jgi:hypothetical protein
MSKFVRTSFTARPELLADLDFLSARMRVSKSAIINDILGGAVAYLRALVESVPANPTREDILRMRGKSEEVIADALRQYRELDQGLFPVEGGKGQ